MLHITAVEQFPADRAAALAAIVGAKYGLVLSFVALAFAMRRRLALKAILPLALSACLAFALTLIGGQLVYHERPFLVLHRMPLIAHGADNGFPSDHSVAAGFCAGY